MAWIRKVLIICLVNFSLIKLVSSKSLAVELITRYRYPVEEHKNIETQDGYLLDMQRIPYGLDDSNTTSRPAILLMHGLLGSAENWLVTGPEKGLAFVLADAGYDVWLGNARGTTNSRKHKWLNPDFDFEYWNFSWHEIGVYDLPAKINYILERTNVSQIFYLGHSQGSTAYFVMNSERPKFNQKIRLMVGLAPVAYLSNLNNPFLRIIARLQQSVNWIFGMVGSGEFLPNNEMMKYLDQAMCSQRAFVQQLCTNTLFLFAGYDSTELNRTALPEILRATPAGASTKQFLHYSQGITSGTFRYYDYGAVMNILTYSSVSPPPYHLNRVSSPVALIYAKNDLIVSIKDVKKLQRELPNVVYTHLVPYERFNHLDFLWASNVVPMVYDQILDLLKQF